jgi:hypothetical protein
MKRNQLVQTTVVVGAVAALFLGCDRQPQTEGPGGSPALGDLKGSAAGVTWTVPARWADMGERQMRVASYGVPAKGEEAGQGAECAVSFFGTGQGGTVEMNFQRWIGQFEQPVSPERSTIDAAGLQVDVLKVTGTYLAPGGMMMQSQGKKEDYRMLGAVVEAPEGVVFFKLTGPKETVTLAEEEFEAMIGSLSR